MRIRRVLMGSILFSLILVTNVKAYANPQLNNAKLELKSGEQTTLKVKNTTEDIEWSTSNKKKVQIKQKKNNAVKVIAKKTGIAKVYANVGEIKLACKCIIKEPETIAEGVYLKYKSQIDKASEMFGIDKNVITAIICTESSGNQFAFNKSSSATGLMQIVSTWYTKDNGKSGKKELNTIEGQGDFTVTGLKSHKDFFEIKTNIYFGTSLLREKILHCYQNNIIGKTRDGEKIKGINLFTGLAYYGPTRGVMEAGFWRDYVGNFSDSHSIRKYYEQIAKDGEYPWIIDDTGEDLVKLYFDWNGEIIEEEYI